jgi:hypothetical protein
MLAQAMSGPSFGERRREARQRTLKAGKIVFNRDFSVFDCVVRNLTRSGACLEVAGTLGVPATFELRLADGTKYNCRLVWRFENRIGVAFQ